MQLTENHKRIIKIIKDNGFIQRGELLTNRNKKFKSTDIKLVDVLLRHKIIKIVSPVYDNIYDFPVKLIDFISTFENKFNNKSKFYILNN